MRIGVTLLSLFLSVVAVQAIEVPLSVNSDGVDHYVALGTRIVSVTPGAELNMACVDEELPYLCCTGEKTVENLFLYYRYMVPFMSVYC